MRVPSRLRFRRQTLLAGVVLAAALAAITGATKAGSQDRVAEVRAAAYQFARSSHEPNPTPGEIIRTTRATANALLFVGTEVETDQPVYVVTMRGNFETLVPVFAPDAPGARRPSRFLTLVYDAETVEVVDWAVTYTPSDLTSLGLPQPLGPPAQG